MDSFDSLIIEHRNVFDADLCSEIIRKFDIDERSVDGYTLDSPISSVKQSKDLKLSNYEDWMDIDTKLFNLLSPKVSELNEFVFFGEGCNCSDTGYQIQKTIPGGGYDWHHDFLVDIKKDSLYEKNDVEFMSGKQRYYTYIIYLNDNFSGGTTDFQFPAGGKMSIKPETGKLLFFPASPFYCHRGDKVTKGEKYIITGWLEYNMIYQTHV